MFLRKGFSYFKCMKYAATVDALIEATISATAMDNFPKWNVAAKTVINVNTSKTTSITPF